MESTFLFSFTAHVSRYGFNPQQTLTERHAVLLVLEQYGFGFWHFEINKRWKGRFLPRHPTWNKNTSIKAAKAWHGRQGDRSELRSVPVKFSRPVFSISKKETTFHLSPLCKKLARTTASGFLSYCEQLGVLFENNTPWKKKSDRWQNLFHLQVDILQPQTSLGLCERASLNWPFQTLSLSWLASDSHWEWNWSFQKMLLCFPSQRC